MNYHILPVLFGVWAVGAIVCDWQPLLAEESPPCQPSANDDCPPPCQPSAIDDCTRGNPVDDDPRNPDTEIEILSPSANSEISTPKPRLSWTAVEGATSYILRVQDLEESEAIQERSVELSEVEVGEDGNLAIDYLFDRPLSPETEYQLIIETALEVNGEEKILEGEVIFSTLSQVEMDAMDSISR